MIAIGSFSYRDLCLFDLCEGLLNLQRYCLFMGYQKYENFKRLKIFLEIKTNIIKFKIAVRKSSILDFRP